MEILMKDKVETVSLNRVKPAHLECEPTTGPRKQRTTPNKKQSSKTTRIASGNPQDPAVYRANGDGGGLRTYSRIPLHLRGKTPGAADAVHDLN